MSNQQRRNSQVGNLREYGRRDSNFSNQVEHSRSDSNFSSRQREQSRRDSNFSSQREFSRESSRRNSNFSRNSRSNIDRDRRASLTSGTGRARANRRSTLDFGFQNEAADGNPDDSYELRRLCDVADWEKVRNWFFSHSAVESELAISRKGENGTTAVHMACKSSAPVDIIEMLLNGCDRALELQDDHGWCPLHYSCHYGASLEVIKVLILSCPMIMKREDTKGRNPLHFAVGNRFKQVPFTASAFRLLTQGGAAKMADSKGMLPIHYSCAYGTSTEVIKALIEAHPKSIYCTDDNGFTPLHYAMGNCERKESPGAIKVILSHMTEDDDQYLNLKHPLLVLAERTRSFTNIPKQGIENAQRCLQCYLRTKPVASTTFFTALQTLPQWLEDKAVVEPFVQELLNEKISKRFPTAIMILDFYSIVITLVAYILAVIESINRRADNQYLDASVPFLYLLPLYFVGVYFLLRECIQILSFLHLGLFLSSWLKRPTNWMEISLIFLIIFWTTVMERGALSIDFFQAGTSITLFFLWMNFLKYLRGMIVEFSVFVSGVVHVLKRLGVFLFALLIILVAFMEMFYTLFLASGNCEGFKEDRSHADQCDPEGAEPFHFCSRWDSFLTVYTMLLGEVDETEFDRNILAMMLFMLFIFLVVILLANVLIAIVADSYGVIRHERAAIVFWSNRLDFIVEMDVISSGPVTKKVKLMCFGENAEGNRNIAKEVSWASNLWRNMMELFDTNGPYLKVEVFSMAFVCLNFLRFVSLMIVIPLWTTLGLCSFGLLWPPQVRKKIMQQKISLTQSAAVVKSEQQINDVKNLKNSILAFRNEMMSSISEQRDEVKEIKEEVTTMSNDVLSDMKKVRDMLENLLEVQESRILPVD